MAVQTIPGPSKPPSKLAKSQVLWYVGPPDLAAGHPGLILPPIWRSRAAAFWIPRKQVSNPLGIYFSGTPSLHASNPGRGGMRGAFESAAPRRVGLGVSDRPASSVEILWNLDSSFPDLLLPPPLNPSSLPKSPAHSAKPRVQGASVAFFAASCFRSIFELLFWPSSCDSNHF